MMRIRGPLLRAAAPALAVGVPMTLGGSPALASAPSCGATITRNTTLRNLIPAAGIDGIALGTFTGDAIGGIVEGTRLDGNLVLGSGHDGIDVATVSTTVTRNLAVHNGNLGIEAVAGVTDGGGNRAFANGNPLQCLNIAC